MNGEFHDPITLWLLEGNHADIVAVVCSIVGILLCVLAGIQIFG